MKKLYLFQLLAVVLATVISACKDNNDDADGNTATTRNIKVAVILRNEDRQRWAQTAEWACQNISEAQKTLDKRVSLQLQYYDQDDPDIDNVISQLARDTTVEAIIGPSTSAMAEKMATELATVAEANRTVPAYRKPMISPTATDVDYQRKFTQVENIWNLSQCDIVELEILITQTAAKNTSFARRIMLIAPATTSGPNGKSSSYEDWFGFICEEYRLNVSGVFHYSTPEELRQLAHQLPTDGLESVLTSVIFIPNSVEAAIAFDDEMDKIINIDPKTTYMPSIYTTDYFVTPPIASQLRKNPKIKYEGVDLYADPESGFPQAYRQHFGQDMVSGEASLYDAVCLVAFAGHLAFHNGMRLNDGVMQLLATYSDNYMNCCYVHDIASLLPMLQKGQCPSLKGATGLWKFDDNNQAARVNSTFRHWRYDDGNFLTVGYISDSGSNHSFTASNGWLWHAKQFELYPDQMEQPIVYPELDDRWALVVAGSKGWSNYRFQADALAMYHILRSNGIKDDHIVLIEEDDIAQNASNPDKGSVSIATFGGNLYPGITIDYKLSELEPKDIADIMQGRSSQRLPHVINPTPNDNVFVFWSSHGSPGSLDFGESRSMYYKDMRNCLENTPHRKMMVTVEACYSGGLGEYCKGLPGVVFLTAASPYETSHASGWNPRLKVYQTNSFTEGFHETLISNPYILLRDLYYSLARSISGSHVKIYNSENYGSVYTESMQEYLP